MQKQRPPTSWEDVPVIIDIPYAARLIGCTVDVLTRKCQKGEFPAHKVFNRWRISKEELISFINQH